MVADVTVVGSGVIALACSAELADRGLRVRLVGTTHAGEASSAAAGMLAPSVERELGPTHALAVASRDRYPGYVAALGERTAHAVPLNRRGILEVALDEDRAQQLRAIIDEPSEWLDREAIALEEPELSHVAGAAFHPYDGCVDPLALLDALRALVARHDRITVARENVCSIHATELGCNVLTDLENRYASDQLVLAAGAWTPLIEGVDTTVAVIEPIRGQMIAFAGRPLGHVVYGPGGYIVPKADGHTMAGSTMEHAGFVASTTDEGLDGIRSAAGRICPALANAAVSASWAGLRPVTPDFLPIIGRDATWSRIVYACGHSRNGILLTPLTAELVADVVTDVTSQYDFGQFRPGRF
jgi:glycine oxidase